MFKRALAGLIDRLGLAVPGPVWDGGAGACVALVDRAGRIRDLSDGAASVTGAARPRLIGRPLAELFRVEDRSGVERALSLGGAAGRFEGARDCAFGDARRLEIVVNERPDGLRTVLLADRGDEGREIAALREAAQAAQREARQKADLLADLSHEMRTPLNAVIGFAEAMNEQTFGPLGHSKYAEYAEHIRASGGHLLDLVTAILDLAKIEADRFALKRESVDVSALARECAGMVRLTAEAAGLVLKTEIDDDLPESFLDPRAVRQIVLNLLSNAVKFTSDGEISLKASADNGDILLTVTDTGVGMSETELARLGARFTAAQGMGVRGAKGNGLGLALAFALSELHGGSMTLESAPGEGLRATVRLPVKARPAPRRRTRPVVSPETKAQNHQDEPAILTQLERIEAYRRERASAA